MRTIVSQTRAEAWLAACEALDTAGERIYNLILEVSSPALVTPATEIVERRVDQFLIGHDCQPLNSVAETIFPATEYRLRGLQGVYDYPRKVYPTIRSACPWGNYALRLTQRSVQGSGEPLIPLKLLIDKGKRQLATNSPKYAAYELDLGAELMELPLYDPEEDHTRVIGGQCLSHISIKFGPRPKYAIYLTAQYRYQYFAQKALGNLLGLARLQACIARELKRPIGPLVCHATLAVLESKDMDNNATWSRKDVRAMLNDCRSTFAQPLPA
jgi:hypothetical protein